MSVKIIRNKNTAVSEGYGFVEFATHEAAEQVLRTFNGCPIPNTDQIFRLNWAAFGVGKVTTEGDPPALFKAVVSLASLLLSAQSYIRWLANACYLLASLSCSFVAQADV